MLGALATLLLTLPQAEADRPPPLRVVMVRTADARSEDIRRFAQGLSASALVGPPVCMLVDAELTPIQRDLLDRLAGAELVAVGEPPTGLPADRTVRQVGESFELFPAGAAAVVASTHADDQLIGAVEACRRRLPLLVAGPGLDERLTRLGVERVFKMMTHREVALPARLEVTGIESAAARLATASPYLAIGNAGAARTFASGVLLGAAALAAAHGGVLHLVDEPVVFDYAELEPRSPPSELAGHPAPAWLTGAFDLGSDEILIAVPQVGTGPGVGGELPRWGDPIVDLDRDGRLEAATESVPIGSVRRLEDRDFSISLRLVGALGETKFRDGRRTQRAVRVAPAAETIAAGLSALYAEAGVVPRSLLIAGDHREVPFDYVEDPVYASSMMHEQELASDNLYADPDGDGYLDIGVGRLVASGYVQATALAARLATRALWPVAAAPRAALVYPAWAEDELELKAPMIFPSFEALLHGVAADLRHAGFATDMHLREAGELERVLPSLARAALVVFTHHSGPDCWQFRIRVADRQVEVDMLVPRSGRAAGRGGDEVPFLAGAPLIVGAGCDSAGLDFEVVWDGSIVHTFFERGALGYLGNTRAGFPDTEEFLLRQTIQAALGMQPGTPGPLPVAEAFRQGKNYLDLLIRDRGPFRCVAPFEDYALAMRREWNSLVYYGDPALPLTFTAAAEPTV
ncbi:MAG: hypothetical protein KDE27_06655, partial [Planctomycetes bacterium]|nr:hypothetical protein [Planctomycetota bacterium]